MYENNFNGIINNEDDRQSMFSASSSALSASCNRQEYNSPEYFPQNGQFQGFTSQKTTISPSITVPKVRFDSWLRHQQCNNSYSQLQIETHHMLFY